MNLNATQPIGIFDSGVGGLTVAHAVAQCLPYEEILYFGDTAHAPYGDKSALTIQRYCYPILDFLLGKGCKLILVACNSATAAAYAKIQTYLAGRALLLGVIEPVINAIAARFHDKTIGLIGTKQTVSSQVFAKAIQALPNHLQFKALATPLLAPIIEENFHHQQALIDMVLALYLQQPALQGVDALILACTHYPLIKANIQRYYQNKLTLLDAAEITAMELSKTLTERRLLNPQKRPGSKSFFVSDYTPAFAAQANQFFGESVALQVQALPACED